MRDPTRIPRILALLAEYWQAHPDLRLGQIVTNATNEEAPGVFYFEDDEMEVELQHAVMRDRRKGTP